MNRPAAHAEASAGASSATTHPIALLTDFGLQDWFVGAMRGEILSRAPAALIFDITHHVPPQNIAAGAFALRGALDSLPLGCVICAVVDPGVGTARRALCGRIGPWFFSGPDNGLATPLLERAGEDFALFEITAPAFRAATDSQTFHGRDRFAPAAACLALGADPASAGAAVADPLRLPADRPCISANALRGRVAWIDHFGNLLTNITPDDVPVHAHGRLILRAGPLEVRSLYDTYGSVSPGTTLAYWGSAGVLEFSVSHGSAAQASGLTIGDPIDLSF